MAPTALRRPPPETIPDGPGCYLFKDPAGRTLYVGKARSLRKRLANYFQPVEALHPRTQQMLEQACSVEWIVASNEVESLHLEYNLIKANRPRYNVRYRDDKSYPYLAFTVGEEVPRAMVMRGPKRPGTRVFGPYAHAYAIRETFDLLLRTFPIRTCSRGVFERCRRAGRPCLLFDIGKCSGPCVGRVSADDHRGIVEEFMAFMDGGFEPVTRRLELAMSEAAARTEFERAARLRDQLASVRTAIERQAVVSGRDEDLDVIGVVEDDLEAALQVFFVRGGRMVGRKGFVVDKVEDLEPAELIGSFLRDLYMVEDQVPPEILVQVRPAEPAVLGEWLSERRGGRVAVRVPVRGEKRALLETAAANAAEAFAQHKLRRRSDFDARARQLASLQEALCIPEAPLRIECFDISNLGASEAVGSMVVFEDGMPKRSEYRRFRIRTVEGQDDFAMMAEVIRRRFARYLKERAEPAATGGRFAYPPNLVVVDGGAGQLGAALGAMAEVGMTGTAVVGLAKRLEEVYLPGGEAPVRLARGSEALHLLQHVRDEAHRVAVGYHRRLRARRSTASALDAVPGIGRERKRLLLRRFGSVGRILQASEDDLAAIVPRPVAGRIHRYLRGEGAGGSGGPRRPPGARRSTPPAVEPPDRRRGR
ncbi:MAG: excinuclease ABC subunit UvrC [Acidobacteria bacterium]|nr:excinuclease ABC subunit UvrC [Acidobacteriota bacterium]